VNRTWVPGSLTELLEELFRERPEKERSLPGVYSVINQAATILRQEILHLKLNVWPADLLVRPVFPSDGVTYLQAAGGIRAGEQAMEEALPRLHEILGKV